MHTYYVYILTNVKRNVMYVGVTNDSESVADTVTAEACASRGTPPATARRVEEFQYDHGGDRSGTEIKGWRRSQWTRWSRRDIGRVSNATESGELRKGHLLVGLGPCIPCAQAPR